VSPRLAPGAHAPYRMRDLCELTGLSRQAIHFYIKQGLVPPGRKAGRNMAHYSEQHVERLLLVRKLQQERLLPLKTIKALLDNQLGEGLDPGQREMLLEIKARLATPADRAGDGSASMQDTAPLLARLGNVSEQDLTRMVELGYLTTVTDDRGRTLMSRRDTWLLELWSQFRAAGFSDELGFSVDDLAIYDDAVRTLFAREAELLLRRLRGLEVAKAAGMVERALPLVHTFFAHYHAAQVQSFFAAVE
jgi:DNA-binding transcriptional MerR regulator